MKTRLCKNKNKYGRRLLSVLLIAALSLTLLTLPARADEPYAVLTPSPQSVTSGGSVDISLSVEDGGAYAGIQAAVTYDASKFAYKSVSPDTGNSDSVFVTVSEPQGGTLLVTRYGGVAVADGETALTLTFEPQATAESAPFGAENVYIAPRNGDEDSQLSVSGASTFVTVTAGKYNVITNTVTGGTLTATPNTEVAPGTLVTLTLRTQSAGRRLVAGTLKLDGASILPSPDGKNINGYATAFTPTSSLPDLQGYFTYTYRFEMPAHDADITALTETFSGQSRVTFAEYENGVVLGGFYTSPTTDAWQFGDRSYEISSSGEFYNGFVFGRTVRFITEPIESYAAKPYGVTDLGEYIPISGAKSDANDFSFKMPDRPVTIYPNFTFLSDTDETLQTDADIVIYTAEELEAFRDAVNAGDSHRGKTVRLGADIDLTGRNWTPVGIYAAQPSNAKPFEGVFDGAGYSVTLDGNILFEYALGAIIENAVTRGSVRNVNGGAVVYHAYNSIVRGCKNYANVRAEGDAAMTVAGIARLVISYDDSVRFPYAPYDESEVGVFDCINYGDVTNIDESGRPQGYIAGVVAEAQRIIRCGNEGDIVGGDDGSLSFTCTVGYSRTTIEECYNTGDLTTKTRSSGHMVAEEGVYNSYSAGNIVNFYAGGGDGPTFENAMMVGFIKQAVDTDEIVIAGCWSTGTRTLPNWDPHWALSFQSLEPFKAWRGRIDENSVAEEPTDFGDAFNEDGMLVWQTAPQLYRAAFKSGDDFVTDILVDGRTPETDGSYKLPNGTYAYSGVVDGVPVSGSFNITGGSRHIQLAAEISFAVPDGAAVAVKQGGEEKEPEDGVYKLPNGAYTYEVTKSGYEPVTGAFDADGTNRVIKIARLAAYIDFAFNVTPSDAALAVYRGGVGLDPVSGSAYKLTEGAVYTYEVSKAGFVNITAEFTAVAGETSKLIELAPASATVTFSPEPADALIELRDASGALVSSADDRTYALAEGAEYTYTASAEDRDGLTGGFTASDGLTIPVVLTRSLVETRFNTTPDFADIVLRLDGESVTPVADSGGKVFLLEKGREYAYTASAIYHDNAGGTVIAGANKSVGITLSRKTVTTTFVYTPAHAGFTLTKGGARVNPTSSENTELDGIAAIKYVYTLEAGVTYTYSTATPVIHDEDHGEFVDITREYTPTADETVRVELQRGDYSSAQDPPANGVITKGGTYKLSVNTVEIATTEPVTLVGRGPAVGKRIYAGIYSTVENANLTLRNVYIYQNSSSVSTFFMSFKGKGNHLYFSGVNIIDADTGTGSPIATIQVPYDAELTIGGVSADDSLYIYKRSMGAGIGGKADSDPKYNGELAQYNGKITFTQGNLFIKGSGQGALIGSGANIGSATRGEPGPVTIEGGSVTLLSIARGAAIGGSAGSSGAAKGTDVYMKGGTLTFNVDWTGAAIGGGGYADGNDSNGGTLYYSGGSIRTFIDENAAPSWDVAERGVNDVAITAKKLNADGGKPVYLLSFDTGLLSAPASSFAVFDGKDVKTEIYNGGLHLYKYINEDLHKNAQVGISYTLDNWVSLSDPNLYLYLTGEDHTLTVNNETFSVTWDGAAKSFGILKGGRYAVNADPGVMGGSLTLTPNEAAEGETVTVTPVPGAGNRLVAGSLKYDGTSIAQTNGVYSFTMPGSDVTVTAEFEPIPTGAAKYAVTISGASGGDVTTDKAEAAEGETVTLTVTPGAGKQLTAGSLKANGNVIMSPGGVYSFLMPAEPVTITARFETIAVTAPNGTKLKAGAAQDLVLRIAKDATLLDSASGVTLNGVKLTEKAQDADGNYTAASGGASANITVVTVSAEYLNTLEAGSYTLTVPFTDGTAVTLDFTISVDPLFDVSTDPAIANGTLTPDKAAATEADTVTVTVTPNTGYRLIPGSLKYDGRTINAGTNGKYTFTMPAWDVTLTAQFIASGGTGDGGTTPTPDDPLFENGIRGTGNIYASPWDGKSLDLTWFDPDARSYTISTPAQLAGLAALVNGLYNTEIDTVAGNASYIRVHTGFGDDDGPQGNNKSTATYHYGEYNFTGKTVTLANDINMGSANYMPIGGQYLMTPGDSTTRIDASFNGVFDGGGHSVTINVDRHVAGNYGDGQSVGLIGRLGVHDNDDPGLRASGLAVRNVIVRGRVYANRSVGGVVGKIGKTADNYAVIENCVNIASVSSTDAKGVGGIVGAAWNGGVIQNCYNAGPVSTSYSGPAGGIAGSVEIPIINCYSIGTVTAPRGYAMGIGTNNGGAPAPENSYYLSGSAADGGWYSGGTASSDGLLSTYMTSDAFVTDLNTKGSVPGEFRKDSTGTLNGGFPVLAYQGGTAVDTNDPVGGGLSGETTVPGTTTVKDDSATTIVDEPVPLGSDPTLVVINVETDGAKVNTITAEITAENVKAIADNGSAIEVRSDLGNVTLPNEAVKALSGSAEKKVDVKLTKNSADTYTLALTADDKAVATVDGGVKLTLPAENVTPGTVAVLVNADGSEEVIKKSVGKDGKVSIPLDGSATVKIVDNAKAFSDVTDDAWYFDGVKFTSSHELFQGDEGKFSPAASMTRGMLVTVLHRLEDTPEAIGELFSDVAANAYYAEAIIWASVEGIVSGTGDGFAPDAEINREQLAVMLYRYYVRIVGDGVLDVPSSGTLDRFPDAAEASDWAEEALKWAVAAGLIQGRDSGLAPKGTATRAEVAVILERFIENVL